MPQLSLYIDNETLYKLERAANIDNKSKSKWVSSKLKSILNDSLPDNFDNLFGSVEENDLPEISELSLNNDAEREKL